jgi:hypothetical protein
LNQFSPPSESESDFESLSKNILYPKLSKNYLGNESLLPEPLFEDHLFLIIQSSNTICSSEFYFIISNLSYFLGPLNNDYLTETYYSIIVG